MKIALRTLVQLLSKQDGNFHSAHAQQSYAPFWWKKKKKKKFHNLRKVQKNRRRSR